MNVSFIFLFLVIQTIGVMASATSMERLGPVRLKTSRRVVMKLMSSTSKLNRQRVMKPVLREMNSA